MQLGRAAVISRTRGTLLLPRTQASVAELTRQALAPDEEWAQAGCCLTRPRVVRSGRLRRAGRECPKQAIAKAGAVRGNAARLLGTPTLCLCKRRDRRSLVARMLLVDGHGVRRWAAEFVAGSRRVTATMAPRRPRARPSPPLPPVTSAPQDLRDVSAVMPVPRLPARPRAAARRLAAATARCASARGRRGGLSPTA
jgi:hypothetical protein